MGAGAKTAWDHVESDFWGNLRKSRYDVARSSLERYQPTIEAQLGCISASIDALLDWLLEDKARQNADQSKSSEDGEG